MPYFITRINERMNAAMGSLPAKVEQSEIVFEGILI